MKQTLTHKMLWLVLVVVVNAAAAGEVVAQDQAGAPLDDEEVVSVNTRLVRVNVRASDPKGRPVTLDGSSLKAYADGVPQETAYFYSQEDPSNVVLLVDVSDSMGQVKAKRASTLDLVYAFLKASDPRNRYTLFVFNNRISKVGEYAGDEAGREDLYRDLKKQKYGGGTAIYSSARETLRAALGARRSFKTALILFTDGIEEDASPVSKALAEEFDYFGGYVAAFVIGDSTSHDYLAARYLGTPKSELKRRAAQLVRRLGCEAYVAHGSLRDYEGAAKRVSKEMTYSVELGFYPKDGAAEPGAHAVRVESRSVEGLSLKTRPGYSIGK